MKITRMTRKAGWLAVAGLLGAALIAPSGAAAAPLHGAIWTSLADGKTVNQNQYATKELVYLNGGPQNCNGNGLPDGDYYFQVTGPSGGALLSSDAIKLRQVKVVGGRISGVSGEGNHAVGTGGAGDCPGAIPVQLIPYDDTPNSGGVYSVDVAPKGEVDACDGFSADSAAFNFLKDCKVSSKNDNFKVGATTTTTTTTTSSSTSTGTSTTSSETTSTTSSETTSTTSSETTSTGTTSTGTTSSETTTASTPSGSVAAETGTPDPTLPSTDTASISGGSTPSSGTWQLLLVAMAALLAGVLLLTPTTATTKR